jgi:hypothetical protein
MNIFGIQIWYSALLQSKSKVLVQLSESRPTQRPHHDGLMHVRDCCHTRPKRPWLWWIQKSHSYYSKLTMIFFTSRTLPGFTHIWLDTIFKLWIPLTVTLLNICRANSLTMVRKNSWLSFSSLLSHSILFLRRSVGCYALKVYHPYILHLPTRLHSCHSRWEHWIFLDSRD